MGTHNKPLMNSAENSDTDDPNSKLGIDAIAEEEVESLRKTLTRMIS